MLGQHFPDDTFSREYNGAFVAHQKECCFILPVRLAAIKSKSPRHSRLDSPASTPSAPTRPQVQDRLSHYETNSPRVVDELTMFFNQMYPQEQEIAPNIWDDRFPSPSQVLGMGALIRGGTPSKYRYSFFKTSSSAFSVSASTWQPGPIDFTQAMTHETNDGSGPA